ncbi:hypothetical protein J4573_16875 [Actinomadura barringtoniae]|uniref:LPXTG cell wall anchor domain-containing protein n=1 Tax=Actinomadura barringtoniae TaxID=1427535 RepID=A0A939T4W6_9ACTN|nr:hypothetical protein [Actinomadura barringtoniae]MBO2448779.1 hypothetical protein [Actinomadura barringtoniae]
MGITRLAAATAAVGGVALFGVAVPASAAPAPPAAPDITVKPDPFKPGAKVTLNVTGCTSEPKVSADTNGIFVKGEPSSFGKGTADGAWTTVVATKSDLKPEQTYVTQFGCTTTDGSAIFQLRTTIPKTPDFTFGFDKVKLSTRTVTAGGKLGMTVTCPTTVTAASASFTATPKFTKDGDVSKATATFKDHLPSVVRVKITCADHGSVSYSTKPGERDVKPGDGKIPKGSPQTGDGTMAARGDGGFNGPTVAGSAALLAGAGLGGGLMVRRRRNAGKESA